MRIATETFQFLGELKENNNRPWFEKNKGRYLAAKENFTEFVTVMMDKITKIEQIPVQEPAKCIFRIYRDVRFSANKDPYKPHLAALLQRGLQPRKCAWYIHIQPGASMSGGGMYDPRPEELKAIRQEIHYHGDVLEKIISGKKFRENFEGIWAGDKLKKAPQGYQPDHQYIDLLKYKHYVVSKNFDDKVVLSEEFPDVVLAAYKASLEFYGFIDKGLGMI